MAQSGILVALNQLRNWLIALQQENLEMEQAIRTLLGKSAVREAPLYSDNSFPLREK